MRKIAYTVRRPIAPNMPSEGMIVSRHYSLEAARRSLRREQDGARKQGGYSQDYIFCESSQKIVR